MNLLPTPGTLSEMYLAELLAVLKRVEAKLDALQPAKAPTELVSGHPGSIELQEPADTKPVKARKGR
jgi:hypothetical protein